MRHLVLACDRAESAVRLQEVVDRGEYLLHNRGWLQADQDIVEGIGQPKGTRDRLALHPDDPVAPVIRPGITRADLVDEFRREPYPDNLELERLTIQNSLNGIAL